MSWSGSKTEYAVSFESCRRCAREQEGGATAEESRESVGLSYVDLLYALPVAAVANLVVGIHPSSVTLDGWANVAVALTAVTCGWVGHHGNRNRLPQCLKQQEEKWIFTTPRFLQFVIEILVIVVYFALVLAAELPHPNHNGRSFELTFMKWLVLSFVLYFFWDRLDIWIATGPSRRLQCKSATEWSRRAASGMLVTLMFVCIFGVICAYVWTGRHFTHHVVCFDLGLIALLIAYRMIQEVWSGGGIGARCRYM